MDHTDDTTDFDGPPLEEKTHHKQVKAAINKFRVRKDRVNRGCWFNDWLLVEFLRRFLIPQMGRIPTTVSEISDVMAELLHVDNREVFFLQATADFLLPGAYKGPRHRDQEASVAGPREVRKHEILAIQIDKTERINKDDRRVARVCIERCATKQDSYPFWLDIEQFDSVSKHLIFRPIVDSNLQTSKAVMTLRNYYSKFLTDQLGHDIKVKITERKDWHALLQRIKRMERQKLEADLFARYRDRVLERRLRVQERREARAKRKNK